MKIHGIENLKDEKLNNRNTPKEAWNDILQFIPKDINIWCPFYNDGNCKNDIEELGYKCIHEKKDFFEDFNRTDGICIDNPPFNIKKNIISILYKKEEPFSLLLPFDTLERKYILKYHNKLQIVIPKQRYSYIKNENGRKQAPPFKSVWFCWNMSKYLGDKELIFLK